MGQLKRRRPQHLLRPDEMLATLASLRLHALLQHGGIWVAVHPEVSELLNQCCTGQMDGGPGTADEVAAVLTPLVGEPQLPQGLRASAATDRAAAATPATAAQLSPPPQQQADAAEEVQVMEVNDGNQHQLQPPPQPEEPDLAASAANTNPRDGPVAAEGGEVTTSTIAAAIVPGAGASALPAGHLPMETEDDGAAVATAAATERQGASGAVLETTGTAGATVPPEAQGMDSDTRAGDPEAARRRMGTAAEATTKTVAPERGGGQAPGRPRGRRRGGGSSGGFPPYSPAAEGCRLVAVRLTLEEAFFLHYVLHCLEVYELQPASPVPATSKHVRILDTEALWNACRAIRSNFVTSYAAYHHLKSKGWIPRSGLLYGVDFVVYQLHPVGAHSDFGVLVMPLGSGPGGSSGSGDPHAPPLSWLDLQITNRLINQVVKKLVLLYLYERPGPDHTTPRCLSNFAVEERLVRRWVPDATRD